MLNFNVYYFNLGTKKSKRWDKGVAKGLIIWLEAQKKARKNNNSFVFSSLTQHKLFASDNIPVSDWAFCSGNYFQVFPERLRRRRIWQILTSLTTQRHHFPRSTSSIPMRLSPGFTTWWSSTLSTTLRSVRQLHKTGRDKVSATGSRSNVWKLQGVRHKVIMKWLIQAAYVDQQIFIHSYPQPFLK